MPLTRQEIEARNAVIETECPICQCQMIAPTAIPGCGHRFCFICLKGVSMNNMGCPICRGPINRHVFQLPTQALDLKMDVPMDPPVGYQSDADQNSSSEQVNSNASSSEAPQRDEKHFWLYRGQRTGWWRFDPRHEQEIEKAFTSQNNTMQCEVIICGKPYTIDFERSRQYPTNSMCNWRPILRVTAENFDSFYVKGLAGVHVPTA